MVALIVWLNRCVLIALLSAMSSLLIMNFSRRFILLPVLGCVSIGP